MSVLPRLRGHEDARTALARAFTRGELPGSLLLHGPAGVGKQRLALWLAQLLVCERPQGEPAEPCGRCQHCRFALRLEHPDVHWFFPLPRPKVSGGPEKLGEALEDARAAELEARRADPYRAVAPGEPVGIYLAQVRTLRQRAFARPALARRKVFLVGDAELLVPQEASPEAANALLKLLEEPPPETTLLLTASDPDALLPTIRSRVLPVRLRPLPEDDVVRFLVTERSEGPERARLVARMAQGSIGRALAFLPGDGEPGPLEALRQNAKTLLAAAAAAAPLPRHAAAHALAAWGARAGFSDLLEALTLWLRDLAAAAAGAQDAVVYTDEREFLAELARRHPHAAAAVPEAIRVVEEAHALAQNNVNPQLALAWLLRRLHGALAAAAAA